MFVVEKANKGQRVEECLAGFDPKVRLEYVVATLERLARLTAGRERLQIAALVTDCVHFKDQSCSQWQRSRNPAESTALHPASIRLHMI